MHRRLHLAPGATRAGLCGLASVALLAAASGLGSTDEPWELAPPDPAVALRPPSIDASAIACAECHADVVAEWAATAHATAWVDELYQAELAERKRADFCHGCHVPAPLLASGELAKRPRAREEAVEPLGHGVSCASCHEGPDGVVLGATGVETDAHPTVRSPLLAAERQSELCAACHATTIGPVVGIARDFLASDLPAQGRTCIGCHMAPVEREGGRAGRSHALQTPRDPAFLRRALALRAERADGGVRVVVANRAGHRVPGLQGRELRLRAEPEGGGATAELVLDVRTHLPLGGEVELALPVDAERVRVVGDHLDPRAEAPVRFLEAVLDVE